MNPLRGRARELDEYERREVLEKKDVLGREKKGVERGREEELWWSREGEREEERERDLWWLWL